MKAIIFGSNGQDGFYLSQLLDREGIGHIKISRTTGDVLGDVGKYGFVTNIIKKYEPDYVFHLAANSTTLHDAIFENHQTISIGTINILEAVRIHRSLARVFISGSAMQFKNDGCPINEKTQFDGSSPYSIARIQSVYTARYYRNKFGIKTYVGYLFNHDSPYRSARHVNQLIIQAVNRIDKGKTDKLEIGDIDIKKEFNYAADIVAAIWILIKQDRVFEAVIGSGVAYSIKDWLVYLFGKINKDWSQYITINNQYKREYSILVSDPKVIKDLGWSCKVGFEELGDIMLFGDPEINSN